MRRHIKTLSDKYNNLKRWQRVTTALVLLLLVILIINSGGNSGADDFIIEDDVEKEVFVKSVYDLSIDNEPLRLVGSVQSESQVDLRAESQGEITAVYRKLGDFVSRGDIIAEIENTSAKSAVSQARSAVLAEESQLKNLRESVSSDGETLAVKNAYRTLLSSGLEAIPFDEDITDTPPIISGTYTGEEGSYIIDVYGSGQSSGASFRLIDDSLDVGQIAPVVPGNNIKLGSSGLFIKFDSSFKFPRKWIVEIPNKRSPVYLSNLNSYNAALDSQRSLGDQITAQEARVLSAKANLDSANANLEKTIIRSPIDGQITSIGIDKGDVVSIYQEVATVANESILEIKTYITESDRSSVSIDSPVIISGKYSGVITNIAPSIDPNTKKIEMSISPDEEYSDLINGQSVSLSISRKEEDVVLDNIFIPLSALKVTAEGVVVLSVDESGLVQKHIVKEGPLVGSKVLITSGITPDMEIITDVRGINVGDNVTVIR